MLDIPFDASIDGGDELPNAPRERRKEPLEVLTWLANDLSGRGIGLRAGQIVTAGVAVRPVPMGRSAVAVIGNLGRVEATLAAS